MAYTRKIFRTGILATALALLTHCSVGPDYVPPELRLPEAFSSSRRNDTQLSLDIATWWETFNDPILNKLVEAAAVGNLDVQQAEARVREARALLTGSRSEFLPVITSTGSYSRSRASKNARNVVSGTEGASGEQLNDPSQSLSTETTDLYEAEFDANWEIDIFGGTRRGVEVAQSNLQASKEERRDTLISLVAEVAHNYIVLRSAQKELEITKGNAIAQKETRDLEVMRLDAGISSDLTVTQVEALLRSTEAALPARAVPIREAIHRISVLLGRNPTELETDLSAPNSIPTGPAAVPPGLPSELLRRRPDIRQAEQALIAANANIGVATADLFPRLELTGNLGLRSRDASTLESSDSFYWSYGPTVRWEILSWWAVLANIEVQNARQEQALLEYRKTVLSALEEVENALFRHQQEQERRALLQKSVEANRKSVSLAQQLNTAGVVDFLNVLDAQRSLYQSESELNVSERTVSTNLVALYKALGGGWEAIENNTGK